MLLTDQEINLIQEFYQTNSTSRQAPGKRDVRSIKDVLTGKPQKIQIRHMLMIL